MRTAVFGGTFDPVHKGHIKMAKQAIEQFGLSKLVVLPNAAPPHKDNSGMTPFNHRLNMLSLAFRGMESVVISDYEANEKEPSYSVNTMRHFRQIYGEDTCFIIGADSLINIHKWYKFRELLSENTFIVFRRKGDTELMLVADKLTAAYGTEFLFADMDYVDISSTMVRSSISSGEADDDLIPAPVLDYIREHNLYRSKEGIIQNELKHRLTQQRFSHTMGVAQTASELAGIHGANPQKAYIAGLLHDCAKCFDKEELLQKISSYGIKLDEASLDSPQLWHSYVGAYEAKFVYNIDDEDIFNAIYYHTIGRVGMSRLEEIIYLADAIEPTRSYPGVDSLRELSKKSLSQALEKYTRMSIEFVKARGLKAHPNAYEVAEFYRRQK